MQSKLVATSPRTFVLIFETGDELAGGLQAFAVEHELADASFKAIGGLSSARLAWFDWETKRYETAVELDEQVEVLSMIGDVALYEGKPVVHSHVIIGRRDGTAHGGHLLHAVVRPTCEVVLTVSEEPLHKRVDPDSKLPLIRLD